MWIPTVGERVRHPIGVGIVRRVSRRRRGYLIHVFVGTRSDQSEVVLAYLKSELKPYKAHQQDATHD
jgi:hypothetical protein